MRVSASTIEHVFPNLGAVKYCISPRIAVSFRPEGTAEMHSGLAAKQAGTPRHRRYDPCSRPPLVPFGTIRAGSGGTPCASG